LTITREILLRMRNGLDKIIEKIKTHILCPITFFSENCTVYEIMSRNMIETEVPQMTSQYGACALLAGLARLCARMSMHTSTRPGTHMQARTHVRKHAHSCTQSPVRNTCYFSSATMISERAPVLRYTYIAPPLFLKLELQLAHECGFIVGGGCVTCCSSDAWQA
jgi:hypothetical protein